MFFILQYMDTFHKIYISCYTNVDNSLRLTYVNDINGNYFIQLQACNKQDIVFSSINSINLVLILHEYGIIFTTYPK
jgi:hypothetical protein